MHDPSSDLPYLAEAPVLVVGAGPIGLVTSYQLAKRGIRTVLIERNQETTKWPKMDITNARSMELLHRLGLAEGLQEIGVPSEFSFDCLFSTGLSPGGELITKWDLPSPDKQREQIKASNDGTMPQYPYRRCSQSIFEAWLKKIVEKEPLIDSYFGVKFETASESSDRVISTVTNTTTAVSNLISSKYVIGCDGANSRVRTSVGIGLTSSPISTPTLLVHLKSRDLEVLHRQGQFWHLFLSKGGILISQDEKDTWTMHTPVPPNADLTTINLEQAVYAALGDSGPPQPFKIDQILVSSIWKATLGVADQFRSKGKRVFLAGDSAHQNIPFGGYGMNTGLGDAYDIGWKLAMFLNHQGGEGLLDAYEEERRPVAIRNVARSGQHAQVHLDYVGWVRGVSDATVRSDSPEGQALRERIRHHVNTKDGENKSMGIEMGYRHKSSLIQNVEDPANEPRWNERDYFATTWPGSRAPHVLLNDGRAIYDLLGPHFTLVDFTDDGSFSRSFDSVASRLMGLSVVHLPGEHNARRIWERDAVLVRPDMHVAWRCNSNGIVDEAEAEKILRASMGKV